MLIENISNIDYLKNILLVVALKALKGLAILLLSWYAGIGAKNLFIKYFKNKVEDPVIFIVLATAIQYLVFAMGVIAVLDVFGINILSIAAGLGLAGFGLTTAFKSNMANIVSGVSLMVSHPFKIGGYIKVGVFEGTVESITLRYTILKRDDQTILVPNDLLAKQAITLQKNTPSSDTSSS